MNGICNRCNSGFVLEAISSTRTQCVKEKLSVGAIVGIVIGCVVAATLLAYLGYRIFSKNKICV